MQHEFAVGVQSCRPKLRVLNSKEVFQAKSTIFTGQSTTRFRWNLFNLPSLLQDDPYHLMVVQWYVSPINGFIDGIPWVITLNKSYGPLLITSRCPLWRASYVTYLSFCATKKPADGRAFVHSFETHSPGTMQCGITKWKSLWHETLRMISLDLPWFLVFGDNFNSHSHNQLIPLLFSFCELVDGGWHSSSRKHGDTARLLAQAPQSPKSCHNFCNEQMRLQDV